MMSITGHGVLSKLILVVVILACIWGYARYFEWKNLYHPLRHLQMTPADAGLEFEDVFFVTEDDRRLHGWWFPCPDARGTIIICHGNAGNIGGRVWMAADLLRLRVNVFLFDYRGFGFSRGIPTENGLYRDAHAAYEVVRARYDDAEDIPVVILGRSLGGAVAAQLALDKPLKGLILESTFTSTHRIGRELYPWLPINFLCPDRFATIFKVGLANSPVLISHSRDDSLIPFRMGQELFEAATEPKIFCELSGDHNDSGWNETSEYWTRMEQFITRCLGE